MATMHTSPPIEFQALSDDEAWRLDDADGNRRSIAAAALIGAFFQPFWAILDVVVLPDTWWVYVPGRVVFSAFCFGVWLNLGRLEGDGLRVATLTTFWLGAATLGLTVPWSGGAYPLYMVSYSLLLWAGGSTLALPRQWASGLIGVMLLLVPLTHWAMGTDQSATTLLWTNLYLLTAGLLCWTSIVSRYQGRRLAFVATRSLLSRSRELAESRLDVLEERAARVSQQAFLHRMSHELRTPLNAILGFTEMARETTADACLDEATEDLDQAAKAGHHLLGLLSEILDLSAIDAGQVPFKPEPIDIDVVVSEVVETARGAAEHKGLTLDVSAAPVRAVHDPSRVAQVVVALLSNAIRFTDRGRVEVQVVPMPQGAEIVVRDTGSGIQAQDLLRIFQAFEQGDNSGTRMRGGAGLGLAVAQGLARTMGGDITVESVPGEGSVFRVQLPLSHQVDPTSR
jgi:signal transduction histidine kinase